MPLRSLGMLQCRVRSSASGSAMVELHMHVQAHIRLYRCTCACTTTVLVDLIVGVAIGVVGRGQPSAYTMAWPTEHGGIRLDGVRSARTTVRLSHTT